jgi:cytochrome c biogenesis protein CcmG/thiol:disulfide interchange protein DsbE
MTSKSLARHWPTLLPLIVVIVLVGIFAKRLVDVTQGDAPNIIPSVLLNRPVPDFTLEPLPGRGEGFSSESLKGHVSLVNIWGSWCVACLSEHPLLMELAAQDAVPIHGIAWRDDPAKSLEWLAKHGDPFDLVGQDPRSEVAIAFGVTGAPETFVVDAEGVIRYKHIGPITPEVWRGTLQPLIAQLRP